MRRAKGSGCLYFRNGRWLLFYRSEGRKFTRSLGKVSKADAELKAKTFLEALPAMGVERARTRAAGIPLQNVWGEFERKASIAPKTMKGWKGNWRTFFDWASKQNGLHSTLDLMPDHASGFLDFLRRRRVAGLTISEDTAFRTLKNIRHVLKAGAGFNSWVELPRHAMASKGKREGFTDAELLAVQKVFCDRAVLCFAKEEYAVMHILGLETGLRLGDCCCLVWNNVDFANGLLTVRPQKTRRYEQVLNIPISMSLEEALRRAEVWKGKSGYVFPKLARRYERNATAVSVDYQYLLGKAGIETSIEREGKRAIPKKTFHSLRHTFVSRLAEKGVSPLVIQSMSGHTTMAMTERYSHIGLEAKRRALGEKIEPEKTHQTPEESGTKKKLDAVKALLESKKDRTPLEEALLALL